MKCEFSVKIVILESTSAYVILTYYKNSKQLPEDGGRQTLKRFGIIVKKRLSYK